MSLTDQLFTFHNQYYIFIQKKGFLCKTLLLDQGSVIAGLKKKSGREAWDVSIKVIILNLIFLLQSRFFRQSHIFRMQRSVSYGRLAYQPAFIIKTLWMLLTSDLKGESIL